MHHELLAGTMARPTPEVARAFLTGTTAVTRDLHPGASKPASSS